MPRPRKRREWHAALGETGLSQVSGSCEIRSQLLTDVAAGQSLSPRERVVAHLRHAIRSVFPYSYINLRELTDNGNKLRCELALWLLESGASWVPVSGVDAAAAGPAATPRAASQAATARYLHDNHAALQLDLKLHTWPRLLSFLRHPHSRGVFRLEPLAPAAPAASGAAPGGVGETDVSTEAASVVPAVADGVGTDAPAVLLQLNEEALLEALLHDAAGGYRATATARLASGGGLGAIAAAADATTAAGALADLVSDLACDAFPLVATGAQPAYAAEGGTLAGVAGAQGATAAAGINVDAPGCSGKAPDAAVAAIEAATSGEGHTAAPVLASEDAVPDAVRAGQLVRRLLAVWLARTRQLQLAGPMRAPLRQLGDILPGRHADLWRRCSQAPGERLRVRDLLMAPESCGVFRLEALPGAAAEVILDVAALWRAATGNQTSSAPALNGHTSVQAAAPAPVAGSAAADANTGAGGLAPAGSVASAPDARGGGAACGEAGTIASATLAAAAAAPAACAAMSSGRKVSQKAPHLCAQAVPDEAAWTAFLAGLSLAELAGLAFPARSLGSGGKGKQGSGGSSKPSSSKPSSLHQGRVGHMLRRAAALRLACIGDGAVDGSPVAPLSDLEVYLQEQHMDLWCHPGYSNTPLSELLLQPESQGVFDVVDLPFSTSGAALVALKVQRLRALAASSGGTRIEMRATAKESAAVAAACAAAAAAAAAPPAGLSPAAAATAAATEALRGVPVSVLARLVFPSYAGGAWADHEHAQQLRRAMAIWLACSPCGELLGHPMSATTSDLANFIQLRHKAAWQACRQYWSRLVDFLLDPASCGVWRLARMELPNRHWQPAVWLVEESFLGAAAAAALRGSAGADGVTGVDADEADTDWGTGVGTAAAAGAGAGDGAGGSAGVRRGAVTGIGLGADADAEVGAGMGFDTGADMGADAGAYDGAGTSGGPVPGAGARVRAVDSLGRPEPARALATAIKSKAGAANCGDAAADAAVMEPGTSAWHSGGAAVHATPAAAVAWHAREAPLWPPSPQELAALSRRPIQQLAARAFPMKVQGLLVPCPRARQLRRVVVAYLASSPSDEQLGPLCAYVSSVGDFLRKEHPAAWRPHLTTQLKKLLLSSGSRGVFVMLGRSPVLGDCKQAAVVRLDMEALVLAAARPE
ncbi:hypothetical protein CHLRE_08g362682v5 [Chlamydomonas reinhardtii]|uniref:Uncharacterized protein n=1 Tax=Chlamydomonas reinhardtii TaxID=3055 RepID=A0A2K3DGM8_CHLRE|nr:uncharacterized protein CHLRE_08g362682v5 [Chlamydomonas reinhardtii]PNW79679.1 hypothetical protein CHLRE_08g362682v5 [Chlamydomonas reinhardtii]